MIRGRLRPLTKNPDNEQYFEYSPSSGFLPSVALGTLLTTNLFLVIRGHSRPIAKSKTPRAVLLVLSRGVFFCDRPSLTPSNNKFISLIEVVDYKEFSEFKEIRELKDISDTPP